MQFGLANTLMVFQNMMNDILREEVNTRKVVVSIDDILIFMEEESEHQDLVSWILEKLKSFI
jgi:hypothetical protein